METSGDRFAVAVLRCWIEPSDPSQIRMRIVRPADEQAPESTIGVAHGIEEAMVILRAWLDGLISDGGDTRPTPDRREADLHPRPKG